MHFEEDTFMKRGKRIVVSKGNLKLADFPENSTDPKFLTFQTFLKKIF